ncbi:MAG TPA: sialidase family protein [Thermoanaerobaculia bacterium]|nr:sialidase family protein [Thermoanaerobaculia bacterium]
MSSTARVVTLLLSLTTLAACTSGRTPVAAGPPLVATTEVLTASAEDGDLSPTPSPKATPAAVDPVLQIGPQVRVDKGGGSFSIETAALTTEADPSEVFAAWYDTRQIPGTPATLTRLALATSRDGGRTWAESLVDVPEELRSNIAADPMFAHDPRTGTTWAGGVSLGTNPNVFVLRKERGAAGFGPAIEVWKDREIDKPWMAAGVDPADPAKTRLYVVHNLGLQVSTDLGNTWSAPASLGRYPSFHPRTGPNGELYIAYWDLADGVMIRRSFDGGRTLGEPIRAATRQDVWPTQQIGGRFPGRFRVPPFAYLAVDPRDGTLYVVYFDTTAVEDGRFDVDLYLTRSTDRGTTWSTPQVINGDGDPPGDQFFPWIEVDRKGRLHLVFYDTRNTDQEDGAPEAWIDAYYAVSSDRGATWSEHRLTRRPFTSAAPHPSWLASQFLGDYNGLSAAGDRAYPVYVSTQNGDADVFSHAITLGNASATCVPDGETLCLNDGRFRVRVAWETRDGQSGTGRGVPLTADSGYFWFFAADNVELVVKVLDACAGFQRYWVFSTGLTDVGVRLTVEDVRTGEVREYTNRSGTPYAPKFDTDAFRTCGVT